MGFEIFWEWIQGLWWTDRERARIHDWIRTQKCWQLLDGYCCYMWTRCVNSWVFGPYLLDIKSKESLVSRWSYRVVGIF